MMNDLDNLKNAWKAISESVPKKGFSIEELKIIVKRRSNNELLKIKRKIIIEWVATILLSVFLVLFVRSINPDDAYYALIFVGLISSIGFLPYLKLMRIKEAGHSNLKNHLNEFIMVFDNLVKQYLRLATVLLPVAVFGGLLLGLHASLSAVEWDKFFTLNVILLLIFMVGLISFGAYWLQKRYFSWIYGKNIQRLRECLAELEQAEDKNFDDAD